MVVTPTRPCSFCFGARRTPAPRSWPGSNVKHQDSQVRGRTRRRRRRDRRGRVVAVLAPLVAFVWPFLFLFPYVLPVEGKVSRDRQRLPDPLLLVQSVSAGFARALRHSVVVACPKAAGFPFYASPFTETFYPLNLPLAVVLLVRRWISVHRSQRLCRCLASPFSRSVCSAGCARCVSSSRTALAAAMVMGVSFKITEILSIPNALHTAAWGIPGSCLP